MHKSDSMVAESSIRSRILKDQRAVEGFFDDLASSMAGDERLAAIAGAMAEEVGGVDQGVEGGAGRGAGLPRLPVREERVVSAEELLAGIDREALETYWRRNDSPMEALQRVYENEVYAKAWDTYNNAVARGMDKGDAWERYIEGGRGGASPQQAGALVDAVMSAYPGKWAREELEAQYRGVEFPSVGEVNLQRKPEAEQEVARAQAAFWDFLNEQLPPGKLGAGAKEHTLVQLVLDGETRGTATAEQYQKALEWLQGWKASNFDREVWGTPADWAEARKRERGRSVFVPEGRQRHERRTGSIVWKTDGDGRRAAKRARGRGAPERSGRAVLCRGSPVASEGSPVQRRPASAGFGVVSLFPDDLLCPGHRGDH